jgi:hypothetical protein
MINQSAKVLKILEILSFSEDYHWLIADYGKGRGTRDKGRERETR